MPHADAVLTGAVTHIFAHRFVIETDDGAELADLTPHGRDRISLAVGDKVSVRGERKPSELKVHEITRDGRTVRIAHGPHDHRHDHRHDHDHDHHHAAADPTVAIRAAKEAGYMPIGTPRRKPKHFEVLAKRGSQHEELHVELDGRIRKTKPADPDEPKWHE